MRGHDAAVHAYTPRAADVGRNTLAAIAIDTAQQTATALRTFAVGRFTPRGVALSVSPRRDSRGTRRFTASGTVRRPRGVSTEEGCRRAVVSVQVKAGRKTISNRRTRLRADCSFSLRVSFHDRARLPASGVLRFRAQFHGNGVMTARQSSLVQVRTR